MQDGSQVLKRVFLGYIKQTHKHFDRKIVIFYDQSFENLNIAAR